jgi:hypothetical protein
MNHFNRVTARKLNTFFMPKYLQSFKKLSIILLLMFSFTEVFSQQPAKQDTPPPLPTRQISGIVKDSTDLGVIGATVSLTSDKDTLKTSTNSDGIFVFKDVKSATYTLVVQSIGYAKSPVMRFKQNDMIPRIVMDPIMLKEEKNLLNEVVISGTPAITYKTDTVEYKASDYVVRANSTVDELLKKMEGMEVGNDGTLVHQGQNVTKAKLNGKEYLGGDIANAIKNLPAEIVDRIQIVDDYGDQAARTGIKDGDPEKVLNITTRTDKSVGNMLRVNGGIGNNKRYDAGLFGTRINGNQNIGINAKFNNTVNGVAGGGDNGGDSGGGRGGRGGNQGSSNNSGSGGTTTSGNGSFSIRDKVGKKLEYNLNYGFSTTRTKSLNDSYSVTPNRVRDTITGRDTTVNTFANSIINGDNISRNHNLRAEIEVNLDSNNFLRFVPTFKYSLSDNKRFSNVKQTGFLHQLRDGLNSTKNTRPQLGASIFYQHIFAKPRRNMSMQVDFNSNDQDQETEQDIKIIYYLSQDEQQTKDSLVNRIIARKNLQNNYRGSFTYVEPLTLNTQLELNAQVNYNGYDNTATTRNIINGDQSGVIDSLSNIYNYSFTQGRIALNYRFGLSNMSKVRFSLGVTAVPTLLSGSKMSLGTTTTRSSFNMIPIARFEYLWSRQQKLSINYAGNAVEPTFDQIQPVRDVSNPQNPIVGNPDLLSTFVHSVNASYNNYIPNSKLNLTLNLNSSLTDNAVIRDNRQIEDLIYDENNKPDTVYITETRFLNMSGVYRIGGNYNISKQLSNRKYNLSLSGSVNYDHRISMNAGQQNINTVLTMVERFGPRINPTEWFEINPNVSYNYTRSENSLKGFIDSRTNTLALNVDGRVYFWDTFLFGYSASKNYVSGINANVTSNPFVVNAYLEKEMFNRRGRLTFQAFDILNQNNFVSRDVSQDGGYTDTKSNALSRYFMLRFSMRLQKWSGAKGKGGRGIMRRGDGSFM